MGAVISIAISLESLSFHQARSKVGLGPGLSNQLTRLLLNRGRFLSGIRRPVRFTDACDFEQSIIVSTTSHQLNTDRQVVPGRSNTE